jgi:hypothetical protein
MSKFTVETKRCFISLFTNADFGELLIVLHDIKVSERESIPLFQNNDDNTNASMNESMFGYEEDNIIKKPKLFVYSNLDINSPAYSVKNVKCNVVNPVFDEDILILSPINSHLEYLINEKITICIKDVSGKNDEMKGITTILLKNCITNQSIETFEEEISITKKFKTELNNKTKFSGIIEGSISVIKKADEGEFIKKINQMKQDFSEKENKLSVAMKENPIKIIYELIESKMNKEKIEYWNNCKEFNFIKFEFNIFNVLNNHYSSKKDIEINNFYDDYLKSIKNINELEDEEKKIEILNENNENKKTTEENKEKEKEKAIKLIKNQIKNSILRENLFNYRINNKNHEIQRKRKILINVKTIK